jgi:hypothetical protein
MTKQYDNVLEAKRCVKRQIKFLENILTNLKRPDKAWRGHAIVTAWCIDRYLAEKLPLDIKQMLEKNSTVDVGN